MDTSQNARDSSRRTICAAIIQSTAVSLVILPTLSYQARAASTTVFWGGYDDVSDDGIPIPGAGSYAGSFTYDLNQARFGVIGDDDIGFSNLFTASSMNYKSPGNAMIAEPGPITLEVGKFGDPLSPPSNNFITVSSDITSSVNYALVNFNIVSPSAGGSLSDILPTITTAVTNQAVLGATSGFSATGDDINNNNYTITSASTSFADIFVDGAVQWSAGGTLSNDGLPTSMFGTFTPNFGLSLSDAAALGGFVGFNWQQTIDVWPTASSLYAQDDACVINNPDTYRSVCTPLSAAPGSHGFLDPVPGGYTYEDAPDDAFPFYYNAADLSGNLPDGKPIMTSNTLTFYDTPHEPCLSVASDCIMEFTTELVGVDKNGNAIPILASDGAPAASKTWTTTFNGTTGGILEGTKTLLAGDPGSGTGGVTFTDTNVPEPSSILLLLTSLISLVFITNAKIRRKFSV